MRKILSVVLAVVMLAAMFVMPANAAEELGLVITEINVDSSYVGKDGTTFRNRDDAFEFVEVYNASSEAINLYDYSLAYANKAGAANFSKFSPIAGPEAMIALGVESGSICSSATNLNLDNDNLYPVNPIEAIIAPGETAVIWLYTAEAYSVAALGGYHKYGSWAADKDNNPGVTSYDKSSHVELVNFTKGGLPIEMFREYYGMSEDVLVVAVDANAVASDETIIMNGLVGNIMTGKAQFGEAYSNYLPKIAANAEKFAGPNGAANAKTDLFAAKYPSAAGRFQLENNKAGTVALVKSEKFLAADAIKTVAVADAEAVATYDYTKTTVITDKTNNYVAGAEYINHIATPGALLDGQVKALATVGYVPVAAGVEEFDLDDIIENSGAEFSLLYSNDFSTTPSFVGNLYSAFDKAFAVSTTNTTHFNTDVKIQDGALAVKNKNVMIPMIFELVSAEDMLEANGDNMYSNFVLSYDIKFEAPQNGATSFDYTGSYTAVIFNYDHMLSYDGFGLTQGGYGYSFNRHKASYTEVDTGSAYYAGNKDEAGKASIINKITNGKVLAAYMPASGYKAANVATANRMNKFIDEFVTVTIYFDWKTGSTVYVNGCKVSEATNAAYNEWSLAKGNFGLGIYANPATNVLIDNIEMYSCGDKDAASVIDLVMNASSYGYYEGTEPATGDATVYVVVAMAVAFVALAAVVIIRRKKATN